MAKTQSDVTWTEMDVDSLPKDARQMYDALKEAQRAAAIARKAFEEHMNTMAAQGTRFIFGYRFGKLSVAIVEAEAKPAKAAPAKLSLSDYLKQQAAMGR